MSKTQLIIFSKDRACQLKLLLESLSRNADGYFDIKILYTYSSDFYGDGYFKLKESSCHSNYIEYIKEENFREDTLNIIRDDCLTTGFCTDDDVLYRKLDDYFEEYTFEKLFNKFDDLGTISLRMGESVTTQTYWKQDKLPTTYYGKVSSSSWHSDLIYWNHRNYGGSCPQGYSLSLDGHIYKTSIIKKLLSRIEMPNPNSMEGNLANLSRDLPPRVIAPSLQCLVALPNNEIAGWNRAGVWFPQPVDDLNKRYLDGYSIDLDLIIEECKKSNCTHWEAPYCWVKK